MTGSLSVLGQRLVGSWALEARHEMRPGLLLTGWLHFEWMPGERFLLYQWHYEHADFPDAWSVLGDTDGLQQHYFDVRGVHRLFAVTASADGWAASRAARDNDDFGQRMSYVFHDEDREMRATSELSRDGQTWETDMHVVCRHS